MPITHGFRRTFLNRANNSLSFGRNEFAAEGFGEDGLGEVVRVRLGPGGEHLSIVHSEAPGHYFLSEISR